MDNKTQSPTNQRLTQKQQNPENRGSEHHLRHFGGYFMP